MTRSFGIILSAVGAIGFCPLASAVVVRYESQVMSSDFAPGTEVDTTFFSFADPVINNAGQIAFLGTLDGPGIDLSNIVGVWSGSRVSFSLVARWGDMAPGVSSDTVFSGFDSPILNANGQVAFRATLDGPSVDGSNEFGIWSEDVGPLGLVARKGDTIPGTSSSSGFVNISATMRFNAVGQTVFMGRYIEDGGGNIDGVWLGHGGSLTPIALRDTAAPGTPVDTVFGTFHSAIINNVGSVAFGSSLIGPDVDASNLTAFWTSTNGALEMIAREGGAAPGAGTGVVYDSFVGQSLTINSSGQLAFESSLVGAGVDSTNDEGFWLDDGSSLDLIVRTSDAAAGTGPGVVLSSVYGLALNNAGHIAFGGDLSGTGVTASNDEAIWSGDPDSLSLIARTGEAAVGTESGVVFKDFDDWVLNNTGQLAFRGFLTGTGVDSSNNDGVWATTPSGQLTLVAREGALFDVDGNPTTEDIRTIDRVRIVTSSDGEDGNATSLNDLGQLVFSATFTDGTAGIFVAEASDSIEGDITGDGLVGIDDLDILLANWGDQVGIQATASGDLSGDGVIGQADLDLVIANWGNGTPPANIPEPGTAAIFGLSALALLRRRR